MRFLHLRNLKPGKVYRIASNSWNDFDPDFSEFDGWFLVLENYTNQNLSPVWIIVILEPDGRVGRLAYWEKRVAKLEEAPSTLSP